MRRLSAAALLALVCCNPSGHADELERARLLVEKYPLVDGHIDVPYRVYSNWEDVTRPAPGGDFDYPRAKAGGLSAPFMSIYTPASTEEDGTAFEVANRLIDQVEAIAARAPERFAMAHSPADVRSNFAAGRISLALGLENGAPIDGDLDRLEHFHARGVRYITLAHSKSNHISDSSYDELRPWNGLSPFGVELVGAMNDVGVMIDISHLSDAAAAEVLRLSRVPVIASHSSVRHFTPDFERNMNDDLIRALGDNGGVIMINFGSSFLTPEANAYGKAMSAATGPYASARNWDWHSPERKKLMADYRSRRPYPYATVSDVADHIDHVVGLIGVDHVGIGSDYDGVGDSLPLDLKDVSAYPNLVAELLRRDYSEDDVAKILGGNLLRVWEAVEAAPSR
jgi:membrane dipeptidase